MDGLGVVAEALLDQAGQRGKHQAPVDPLFVHQLEARRRLPERRDRPHRLPEDLAVALALGIPVAEVVLLGTGSGHDLEGRVRDVVADVAPDDDLGPTPHVDVVDHAAVPLRKELRQRVAGLVEMVVGIEHRDVGRSRRHGHASSMVGSLLGEGSPVRIRFLRNENTVS
jgi:hypothetical protein